MRPYYIKRRKYSFKIQKERRTREIVILTSLALLLAGFLFVGARGISKPSSRRVSGKDEKPQLRRSSEQAAEAAQASLKSGPKLAIIIDDVGYVQTYLEQFKKIKVPLTFSVLAHTRHSKANAELFHSLGQEIMLHLPMENSPSQTSWGPGEINTKMSDEQIIASLDGDLGLVPYVKGINNHEGRFATGDKRVVTAVLKRVRERDLFFVDSVTTGASVVCQVQGEVGLPRLANDWFIDNRDTLEEEKAQLQKLADVAKKKGVAIGIGHIQRANTAQAIIDMAPVIQSQGVQFVFVSQIVGNR